MALSKLNFRPGINKEVTRYSAEGGWYDCDKVRFRQGFPEKIGGWEPFSSFSFQGICRSIFTWVSLQSVQFRGIGTHLKFYAEFGGFYYDITPIRYTSTGGSATFSITTGSSTVTVTDVDHGAREFDFVTFSQAVTLGASNITADVLNKEYQITEIIDEDTYTITARDANDSELVADATVASGGGALTVAAYQIQTGYSFNQIVAGWGAGAWNEGTWGITSDPNALTKLRLWSQSNFGEDLLFCHRGGKLAYWDTTTSGISRAVLVEDLVGASQVPLSQNIVFVSDVSRFVFCFGTNDVFSTDFDPMLVRWSDQESFLEWSPSATNQAGSIRLSKGSEIVSVIQSRQEILVWTDTSVYSFQYVGPPIVWSSQIVADNITIASQNASIFANNTMYWMGKDAFYTYAGQAQVLPCSLLRYVFDDINTTQFDQIFAGSNEQFYEIWWFYPSASSDVIDRYVVFNYADNIWYHGNLSRTAWDNTFDQIVAATYNNNLVIHEAGNDDNVTGMPNPLVSYISSAETDIDDGDKFSFIWRILPDITFVNSSSDSPSAKLTLLGLKNSGSGYTTPASVGGQNERAITKQQTVDVEQFTEQLNIRIRGRQIVLKVESDELGVKWQLGSPRIDIRPDGRR